MLRQFVISTIFIAAWGALAARASGETFESFLEPSRRIDLAPAESGLIDEILIREGDHVTKGQLLASLDKEVLIVTREIAAATAEAIGKRNAALAEFQLREVRLKKIRELRAQGHASNDELQRAEAELAAAAGQRRSIEEQQAVDRLEIRKADAQIERRLIRSPIDGVVTKLHREQGEFVTPVAPTVVTVTQLHPLRAVFNLPHGYSSKLTQGGSIEVQVGDLNETVAAKLELISPIIDADSGTVRVKVLIDNAAGKIQAGGRCFVHLTPSEPGVAADPSKGVEQLHVVGQR
jgi:RND family efflux transporter MFP subunit